MCKICIIAAVWLLEKKNIFLQRVHSFREEKGANLLVLSEKWLSRIQSFFLMLVVSFTERILQNLMQEFYILDLYVEVRFFCRSPMEYIFEQELLFVWNWYCRPKVIFIAKIILKEKIIHWIWSVYVVLKNSIIVKKMQNHFCDDRAVVCLDSYVLTSNHIT